MHVERTNQKFSYVMNCQILDTLDSEKDLGVMISSDLKSSNQSIHARGKAGKMLGMIKRTISYKLGCILNIALVCGHPKNKE